MPCADKGGGIDALACGSCLASVAIVMGSDGPALFWFVWVEERTCAIVIYCRGTGGRTAGMTYAVHL